MDRDLKQVVRVLGLHCHMFWLLCFLFIQTVHLVVDFLVWQMAQLMKSRRFFLPNISIMTTGMHNRVFHHGYW